MALTYTQITAITEKKFIPKLVDNVYKSNPIFARFTRPDKLLKVNGGERIVQPIISSKPSTSNKGYFSDLDTLNTDRTDNITAAEYFWKQNQEPIRVSRLEMLKNNGDAAKLKLVMSKTMIAEKNIKENLGYGSFSDGTEFSSKIITGFAAMISESSTYGGIAVADLADWVAQVEDNSGTARPVTLALLQRVFGLCTQESDKPSMLTCKQAIFDQIWSLYQPTQRLVSAEMSKLGFDNVLEFNGQPIIVDSHNAAGEVLFLNEDYVQLAVHPEENLRSETIERMETSASMLARIFWAGNIVCSNRRFQGKLSDLSYAA